MTNSVRRKRVVEQTPIAMLTDEVHEDEPLSASPGVRQGTRSMVFVTYSATAALATLVAALAGILVQWLLTASYIAESRSMVTSVVGLVGTLVSVVIGLLVWTSYGLFNAQQSDLEVVGRSVARLHFALRQFGPEAATARAVLRKQALQVKARFWPDERGAGRQDIVRVVVYKNIYADVQAMLAALATLHPTDQEQRESLALMREIFAKFVETQLSMIRTLANRVPNILLNVVVGWACALFFGYGLLAGINALTLFMAAIGSVAIASSIFLILEMSDPYTGLFQISSTVFDQLIHALTEQS